ncbi:hypothetical protein [Streptomyces caniferus]|uniref:hypothetical protein n=1 Tax=Streptomyces caniferus TaxID=285557 RepID=UPI0038205548
MRDSGDDPYDRSAIDIKPHSFYVILLRCGGCGSARPLIGYAVASVVLTDPPSWRRSGLPNRP